MESLPLFPSVLASNPKRQLEHPSSCVNIGASEIDLISIADILRNGFATPPYTVSGRVRLDGCDEVTDLVVERQHETKDDMEGIDYIDAYHKVLCGVMRSACGGHRSPWLLQSGGKDSLSLAIALAEEFPGSNCITYSGGREEDEVASARYAAGRLGLRHQVIIGDCDRAYRSYLSRVKDMPLITGDAALLSYFDIMSALSSSSCDAVIDGIGSDIYFGYACSQRQRWELRLALGLRGIDAICGLPGVRRSFLACYFLSTLTMIEAQRTLPASRFADQEVDSIMGREMSTLSRRRMEIVVSQSSAAKKFRRSLLLAMKEIGGAAAKGTYAAAAYDIPVIFPFMDRQMVGWTREKLPAWLRRDPHSSINKVVVRQHIDRHLGVLPYVEKKGCFRFDLVTLATTHFDVVMDMAKSTRNDVLPNAERWLIGHRKDMTNKYFASKFYLLAVLLPWINSRS